MHAFEITKNELKPGEYDCVMTISGDGLIHEAVNGAFSREDRDEFLEKTTFGFVPAGTANGLIASILKHQDESFGIMNAAFLVAKGSSIKMDLTELTMEYQPDKKLYMFLSLAWAIVSDIDINSEVIRCIGPTRFTIWGIYRLINLRNYLGNL
jgi:sphingosine kinase